MSRETKAAFYSTIAHTMFAYRKYPTREEYVRIASEIIARYPFLKPPKGSPTVSYRSVRVTVYLFFIHQASIKQSLINRFKNFVDCPRTSSQLSLKAIATNKSKSKTAWM